MDCGPRPVCQAVCRIIVGLSLSGSNACATTSTETRPGRTPEDERERLVEALQSHGSPCPVRPAPAEGEPGIDRVFWEATLIELPVGAAWNAATQSLASLARVPGARLLGTPHVLAPLDTTSRMDVGETVRAPGAVPERGVAYRALAVYPRHANPGYLVLDTDIELETPAPGPNSSGSLVQYPHVRETFAVRLGQTIVFRTRVPTHAEASLVVVATAYPVRGETDLRDLFLCKMEQRRQFLGSHPGAAGESP